MADVKYRVEVALIGGQTLVWVATAMPKFERLPGGELSAISVKADNGAPVFVRAEHISAMTATTVEPEPDVTGPNEHGHRWRKTARDMVRSTRDGILR